ncbi:MAG: serine protease [Treponemataceae bacterium]|nr:serine protease [Treponemataceae bacterium]
MKKRILLLVCMIFVSAGLFAQLRSYVGIVRQQYDEQFVTIMEEFKDNLRNNGYTTYAKYIDAYLKGGFGSGFIYVAPDGKNYVVTNRHVVPQAATVSIEFEDSETGEIKKYENLKVIAEDDEIDIVVCAFPDGQKPFKTGLKFSNSALKDGDEVFTAGYPGLGGDPVWQFGKGTVTNSRARIKEMLDPSISHIIQHSAQVDSGNSGGPLLVADKSAPSGYAVVGINTWKAFYRDSTNYSIPVNLISSFVEKTIKGNAVDTEVQLKARAQKFAEIFADSESDFTDIARYISYDYVAREGKNAFYSVLRYSPSNVRSFIANVFTNNPIEGLKYSLAYKIFTQYRARDVETAVFTVSEPVKNENNYKFVFEDAENKNKYEAEWSLEHGLYRICENTNMNEKKSRKDSSDSKKSGKSDKKSKKEKGKFEVGELEIDGPSLVDFRLGSSIPLASGKSADYDAANSANVDMDIWFSDIVGMEMGFALDFPTDYRLTYVYTGLGLKVPLNFGSIILSPFVTGGIGFAVLTNNHDVFDFDNVVPGISISYNFEEVGFTYLYMKHGLKLAAVIGF